MTDVSEWLRKTRVDILRAGMVLDTMNARRGINPSAAAPPPPAEGKDEGQAPRQSRSRAPRSTRTFVPGVDVHHEIRSQRQETKMPRSASLDRMWREWRKRRRDAARRSRSADSVLDARRNVSVAEAMTASFMAKRIEPRPPRSRRRSLTPRGRSQDLGKLYEELERRRKKTSGELKAFYRSEAKPTAAQTPAAGVRGADAGDQQPGAAGAPKPRQSHPAPSAAPKARTGSQQRTKSATARIRGRERSSGTTEALEPGEPVPGGPLVRRGPSAGSAAASAAPNGKRPAVASATLPVSGAHRSAQHAASNGIHRNGTAARSSPGAEHERKDSASARPAASAQPQKESPPPAPADDDRAISATPERSISYVSQSSRPETESNAGGSSVDGAVSPRPHTPRTRARLAAGPIIYRVVLVSGASAVVKQVLGDVEVPTGEEVPLSELRKFISANMPAAPRNYIFLKSNVPIGVRQESKRDMLYVAENGVISIRVDSGILMPQ